MFGSILLRFGTYLVEKFIGRGNIKDGGARLENVKNAIESRITDVKKVSEIENIRATLAEIEVADDQAIRAEKIQAVLKQIDDASNTFDSPKLAVTGLTDAGLASKISRNLLEASLFKWVLGAFFLILLVYPTLIKSTIDKSQLGTVFGGALSTISQNVRSVKVGNWEIGLGVAENVSTAATGLKNIDLNKITDNETKQKVEEVIGHLTNADNTLKNEIVQNDKSTTDEQTEGWVYLGKTRDKATIENGTVDKANLKDLKPTAKTTFTDSVYLRKEKKDCPRSTGEIITAIPIGETVTLQGDASSSLCPISDTGYFSIWVKVKRN